jgi:hypothetical protein
MSAPGASAAPSWAETTVRFLAQKYPHYLWHNGSAHQRLADALVRMSFLKLESERSGADTQGYIGIMQMLASTWSEENHAGLVKWLAGGGYSGQLKRETEAAVKEMAADVDSHVVDEYGNPVFKPKTRRQLAAERKARAEEERRREEQERALEAEREQLNDEYGTW